MRFICMHEYIKKESRMVEAKAKEIMGEEPKIVSSIGSYVPANLVGNFVYTSGQIPMKDGKPIALGKVGKDLTVEQGQECAKLCAFNSLGALKSAVGDLEKIEKIVKLTVFVNSAPGFTAQPTVANGASDFFVNVFGDKGKHARSAVGVAELPIDVPVEIEVIALVK
eukprot:TRINITY_DN136006_c1_g1_i1.p3 TRINITY_DN136006_c1_g1~~TRINITY_DN136006_c1_g1_i1.p3  ORF type:complete len:167 (-),score=30.85 TRINITY_DN136006_c1_g1_i1:120-620(-)